VEYEYKDHLGRIVGIKVRKDTDTGKEICWSKPLKKAVPYKLDTLRNQKTIYILEGEKAVDHFISFTGWKATCSPNGSNVDPSCAKWLKEMNVQRAVILKDNDNAGEKYAKQFATDLLKEKISCKIISLPDLFPSEDFVDWIEDRRGTLPRLIGIIKNAKVIEMPSQKLKRMTEVETERVKWLWDNRIPRGYLTIIYGMPSCGKSFITSALASAGSVGRGLPFQPSFEPFRSLFLLGEDSSSILKERLEGFGEEGVSMGRIFSYDEGIHFTEEGIEEIKQMMRETRAKMVVIDPLNHFFPSYVNTSSDNEVREILSDLLVEARERDCALVCVSHLNKSQGTEAMYRLSGSSGLSGLARSMMLVGIVKEEIDLDNSYDRSVIVHVKSNLALRQASLEYKIYTDGTFEWKKQVPYNEHDLVKGER
tara:strand:- start:209 stop:1477 length:1269 start_codon:yes stop_codon:yes gene_type:complete